MKKLLLSFIVLSFVNISFASDEQVARQFDDLVYSLQSASNADDLSGRSQYTLLFEYDLKSGIFGNGKAEVLNMRDLKFYSVSSPDLLDIAAKKVSYSEFQMHDELTIQFSVLEYQRQGVNRGAQSAMFTLMREKSSGKVKLMLDGTVEEKGTILKSDLTKDKYTIAFIENRTYEGNQPLVLTINFNDTLDMTLEKCTDRSLRDCTYVASYLGGKFIQNGFRR
jgi:hypothetical protein